MHGRRVRSRAHDECTHAACCSVDFQTENVESVPRVRVNRDVRRASMRMHTRTHTVHVHARADSVEIVATGIIDRAAQHAGPRRSIKLQLHARGAGMRGSVGVSCSWRGAYVHPHAVGPRIARSGRAIERSIASQRMEEERWRNPACGECMHAAGWQLPRMHARVTTQRRDSRSLAIYSCGAAMERHHVPRADTLDR